MVRLPGFFSGGAKIDFLIVMEGRARTFVADNPEELEEVRRRVEEIVEHVRERGMFKTRTPEGKPKDH